MRLQWDFLEALGGLMVFIAQFVIQIVFIIVEIEIITDDTLVKIVESISMTSQIPSFIKVKFQWEQCYLLMNLRNKSIKQLSEELDYSHVIIGCIVDKFRSNMLKNNEGPNISSEIEFDEIYISSGEKGVKKLPMKKRS